MHDGFTHPADSLQSCPTFGYLPDFPSKEIRMALRSRYPGWRPEVGLGMISMASGSPGWMPAGRVVASQENPTVFTLLAGPGGVLLVSWVALRSGALPKVLGWLGVAIGVMGLISIVPPLFEAAYGFGLLQIVWFVWLGVTMTTKPTAAKAGRIANASAVEL